MSPLYSVWKLLKTARGLAEQSMSIEQNEDAMSKITPQRDGLVPRRIAWEKTRRQHTWL